MKTLDVLSWILMVVGALNWGLVGLTRFDLVAAIFGLQFGEVSFLSAVVYLLVGVAGLYEIVSWKAMQRRWQQPSAAGAR
jgi:uncharacterized membrane protein YuzA (DUF378 family)